jgi:Carboxypeptidase regulatory-like domain
MVSFRFNSRIFVSMIALLAIPACLSATTISGTIKDGTGAVIPDAHIEIRGGDLAQAVIVTTDRVGHFVSPDLKTGTYSLRVTAEGFAQLEQSV